MSSSSYIVAQSTVDLDYINTSETRNVYVSAVSKDLSTNKLNKITSYAEGTASASAPQLVKINNNSFFILFNYKVSTRLLSNAVSALQRKTFFAV